MPSYYLEFILCARKEDIQAIKDTLKDYVRSIEVQHSESCDQASDELKVTLEAPDPTLIFDLCREFGKMKSVKVDEIHAPYCSRPQKDDI